MLHGKVAIVTGAGRGIGRTIAETLASYGVRVAICSRSKNDLAETAESIFKRYKTELFFSVVNIARPDEIESFVRAVSERFGRINALVNNAAVPGPVGFLEEIPMEEWVETIRINLLGMVYMTRLVVPLMKKQNSGSIINNCGGGVGWRKYSPQKTAYRTSKFAVYGFTESLAQELLPFGIRVNAILPGSVDTRLRAALLTESHLNQCGLNEDLSPIPAAELTSYLISDTSKLVTGRLISAIWDNWQQFSEDVNPVKDLCRYTLRRIDGRNYNRCDKL